MGVEAEADELPAPQLVQDLARLGVAEVVALRCLGLGQRLERGAREGWLERQRLVRGDQAVPAEDGQEPGHAAGRHRPAEILLTGPDPQRGEVDEAAVIDVLEIVARFELRRPLEPFLQRQRHRGLGGAERVAPKQRRPRLRALDRSQVDAELPAPMRLDGELEGDAVALELALPVEAQAGAAAEAVLLEAQRERALADLDPRPVLVRAGLLRLENIGEVGREAEVEPEQALLGRVLGDDDVLVRALGDEAVALDGERRVLALGRRDDAAREVVDRPARERLQRLSVYEQPPFGHVSDVVEEESFRLVGLDVAVLLREEERALVESSSWAMARLSSGAST